MKIKLTKPDCDNCTIVIFYYAFLKWTPGHYMLRFEKRYYEYSSKHLHLCSRKEIKRVYINMRLRKLQNFNFKFVTLKGMNVADLYVGED